MKQNRLFLRGPSDDKLCTQDQFGGHTGPGGIRSRSVSMAPLPLPAWGAALALRSTASPPLPPPACSTPRALVCRCDRRSTLIPPSPSPCRHHPLPLPPLPRSPPVHAFVGMPHLPPSLPHHTSRPSTTSAKKIRCPRPRKVGTPPPL